MNRDRIAIEPTSDDAARRAATIDRAVRRGFRTLVIRGSAEVAAPKEARLFRRGPAALTPVGGGATIPIVKVSGPGDIESAAARGRSAGAVAVEWTAERIIPLENLIASGRGSFETWVLIERAHDLPAMLGALEHGADHIVLQVDDPAELDQAEASLDEVRAGPIPWELVPVHRLTAAGVGDRVIVDTTSILRPSEGLLVGSAAAFLFHVASEAEGSRFTRPRPFRVNAGAAHSYVLLADGTTRYLSELQPGDSVLVAEPRGRARSVRVGRIKIERRPMVMVEADRETRRFTVFLQDAETVRLSGEDARRATTDLTVGTKVFGAPFPPARHLGGVVEETIDER